MRALVDQPNSTRTAHASGFFLRRRSARHDAGCRRTPFVVHPALERVDGSTAQQKAELGGVRADHSSSVRASFSPSPMPAQTRPDEQGDQRNPYRSDDERSGHLNSENGRGADEPRAKLVGNGRVEQTRRIEGETTMVRSATKTTGEKIAPATNFAPVLTEQEAAAEFSAVILDFSAGELARASRRSKETAKCWKAGRAFPNGVSLLALVNEFPKIRAWVNAKTGGFDSPRGLSAAFALVEQIMATDTPDARAMRARLQQLLVRAD